MSLFTIKDELHQKALEAAAGFKLSNIVVENEKIASELMSRKCFRGYVNLMPMNKIKGFEISSTESNKICNELSGRGGNVIYAMDAIKFDSKYTSCFKFVFGAFFICSNTELAKIVSQKFKRTAVNLEGDIFDPQGTLSGGYVSSNNSILNGFKRFQQLSEEELGKRREMNEVDKKLTEISSKHLKLNSTMNQLENLKYKLDLKKESLRKSTEENGEKKVRVLEAEIKGNEETKKRLVEEIASKKEELKILEKDKDCDDGKKVWTEKYQRTQNLLKSLLDTLKILQDSEVKDELKKERLTKALIEYSNEIDEMRSVIEGNAKEIRSLEKERERLQCILTQMEKERNEAMKKRQSISMKVSQLQQHRIEEKERLDSLENELRRSEAQIVKLREEIKENVYHINSLEKNYPFISKEKSLFGIQGGDFDFTKFDYESQVKAKTVLSNEFSNLSRKVNIKADAMCDKMTKEFDELCERKKILENDKITLISNIAELDEKRKEAIIKCYDVVNGNFTRIFSTLLKGATAKLVPSAGKLITESMEIHVAFGGTWKTSLSELSGGQRSLLALSFILSLLQYKPAPFYILDEIDAALDLSHTENIGSLISKHFPQSQFIIISLKDGMFSNANILYKTSFHEGISKVERFAMRDKGKRKSNGEEEKDEGDARKKHLLRISK